MRILDTFRGRSDLVSNLVQRELKQRYKGSALGFLWSLLTPLFMALIYVVFLRILAGRGVPVEEIIIGVFAWQFTAQSVTGGLTCITGNANLVKKVAFPRAILPVACVLANLVGFLLSLVVQFAIVIALLALRGESLSLAVALLPAAIGYQFLVNLALALLVAALNVYYRDTQHLVGVLMSAWFFLSPVMYNLSFVAALAGRVPAATGLYMLNPLAVVITGYRALILPGVTFPWNVWSVAGLLWPLALLAVAWALFQWMQRDFADML